MTRLAVSSSQREVFSLVASVFQRVLTLTMYTKGMTSACKVLRALKTWRSLSSREMATLKVEPSGLLWRDPSLSPLLQIDGRMENDGVLDGLAVKIAQHHVSVALVEQLVFSKVLWPWL